MTGDTDGMSPVRLGLLGLLAVVLILGGAAGGRALAFAADAPAWLGLVVGFGLGFAASTLALRRGYART